MLAHGLKGLFQLGYVCNDFERGMAVMKAETGIRDFLVVEHIVIHEVSGAPITMTVAMAYLGDTMIELIEPEAGRIDFYTNILKPDGFDLRFHHLGVLQDSLEDYERTLASTVAAGNDHVLDGVFGNGSRFSYVRSDGLNHHLEYVWLNQADQGFFNEVPRQ